MEVSIFCPACKTPDLISVPKKDLNLINLKQASKVKQGTLYQCIHCSNYWYTSDNESCYVYSPEEVEYLYDWNSRDIIPGKEVEHVLATITGLRKGNNITYPVKALTTDGQLLNFVLLHLSSLPPSRWDIGKGNWFYIDQIKSIERSPYAFSNEVLEYLNKAYRKSENNFDDFLYLRDPHGDLHMFHPWNAPFFESHPLKGEDLQLALKLTEDEKKTATMRFDPDGRRQEYPVKVILGERV